jgi:uncharacterized SAM-binding protein YcdF (DUF218 family)
LVFSFWLRGAASAVYAYQDTVDGVHLPPVDAIVCLAGGRGRISAAGDLWVRYRELALGAKSLPQPVLYFSGLGPQSTLKSLQTQLRTGVSNLLSSGDVILETESTNTEENALWLLKLARERRWRSVLLVTSSYHMRRARYIFEQMMERQRESEGQVLRFETLSVFQEPFDSQEWSHDLHGIRVTLQEYLKWLYYSRFWTPS